MTIKINFVILHLTIRLNVKLGGTTLGLQNTLKALADPIRREILNLLKTGKMSAGEITDHFSVTGASISRHLSVLKDADLIIYLENGRIIEQGTHESLLEKRGRYYQIFCEQYKDFYALQKGGHSLEKTS